MARKKTDETGQPKQGRIRQIRTTYRMTKKADPKLGLVTGAWLVGVFAVVLAVGFLVGQPVYFGVLGLMAGLLAWTMVFGRRAERAAYRQIEGQPGAAAAVLQTLKRGWTVTPGVAATPTRDPRQAAVVHRAVGRPGIVLIGEGPPSRVTNLLAQERKKHARVVPDVPIHDLHVGTGEGQVSLAKLQRTVMKLPRVIRPPQAAEAERRLKAVGSMNLPLPKGPMPKGMRMPRGPQAPRSQR